MELDDDEWDLPNYCKHDLQFYEETVGGNVDLAVLQKWCVQRLEVLGIVREISMKENSKNVKRCRDVLISTLKEKNYNAFGDLIELKICDVDAEQRWEARKMDNVSHNMIRLFFSKYRRTREWFRVFETILFQWRIENLDDEEIVAFKAINEMNYPELNDADKRRLKNSIMPLMEDPSEYDETVFYKVSVFDVLELLQQRIVYIQGGQTYITETQFRCLIYNKFRQRLASRLEKSIGAYYYVEIDLRLQILEKYLQKRLDELVMPILWNLEKVTVDKLDMLAEKSYPPCMRRIHESLLRDRHIRNGARFQYTVFLKAIGLPGLDADEFYKKIFTEKVTEEQYEKEYGYRFRYMYGLTHVAKNYVVSDCGTIAMGAGTDPKDCHGCFFARRDIEDLGRNLDNWKISEDDKKEMIQATKNGEIGKACAKYFESIHGCPVTVAINNPKTFYGQSRTIRKVCQETEVPATTSENTDIPKEKI